MSADIKKQMFKNQEFVVLRFLFPTYTCTESYLNFSHNIVYCHK